MNPTRRRSAPRAAARRGFSMIELLIALTISATLMAATLVALDVMFKRYQNISDSASTHVIARTVMQRVLAQVRTGAEFGPAPADVYDTSVNPGDYDNIRFLSAVDEATGRRVTTRVEVRDAGVVSVGQQRIRQRGPRALWIVIETDLDGVVTVEERPLLDGVVDARFNLEYGPGPRLLRATFDLTVLAQAGVHETEQDGTWSATTENADGDEVENRAMFTTDRAATIRLVASTAPRAQD